LQELVQGLLKALDLLLSLDREVLEIASRSLGIAMASTFLASLLCIPAGSLIHFRSFPGKKLLISVLQTLYSLPTVGVGLFVFILFSKAGPFGGLGILFTPVAMVLGQVILISPILTGLTVSALSGVDRTIRETAASLGASDFQTVLLILREARFAVMAAVIMGFGRAISELGSAMMVGGNIKGFTRVLTTAIALETQKGELELAIALGIILIAIALLVNIALSRLQQR